ncbi:MAG: hypothetical protein HRU28_17185, partial [Rhizobiales bacterium]|nr:hypothetical protein [Hyphomicrobiales bacterium]
MPEIYNIPAGYSFLRELARAILSRKLPCLANMDTNNLSQVLILLPTQRACRDLREILFEENNKKALIMPEIKAFGALEDEWVAVNSDHSQVAEIFDIEQAIAPLERHLILAKYISKLSSLGGIDGRLNLENPAMALHMAKDLAKLFDSVLIEEADPSKFEQLVEAEFAENWLLITKFLDVVFKTWPDVLAEVGKVDQIVRRQKLMQLELLHLQNKEVEGQARPIIAAGSTASVAATKKFLSGILGLSQGCVILSGLDTYMDEESWEEVSLAHPQNNLKNFLSHANVKREDVLPLPSLNIADDDALTLRAQIASEMVRPTATSHMWHNLPEKFNKRTLSDAISGNVELVEANNVQQEAIIIALMMRKAVEDKQKAALITPDRQLARRVQNELKRWNIHVDDSSGVPLSDTPPSIFLKHIIDVQLHEFSPSSLLSLLKHPYFRTKFSMDMDRISAQKAIYALELILLRGVRPAKGIDGLLNVLQLKFIQKFEKNDDYQYQHKMVKQLEQQDWQLVKQLLENLAKLFASFDIKKSDNFAVIFAKHLKIAEQLSLIDSNENSIIWQSNEGEALAQLSSEILQSQENFEKVNISEYEALLANLMA